MQTGAEPELRHLNKQKTRTVHKVPATHLFARVWTWFVSCILPLGPAIGAAAQADSSESVGPKLWPAQPSAVDLSGLKSWSEPTPAADRPLPPLPEPTRPALPQKSPVFRSHTGIYHFFSLAADEGPNAGFTHEGTAFFLFVSPVSGMVALYRCYSPRRGRHYLTLKADCGDTTARNEGALGYLWSQSQEGTLPLHQCYLAQNDADLTTTNTKECLDNNYQVTLTLGYL